MDYHVDSRIHSTRLKNGILAHFEDLKELKEGREVFLAIKRDIDETLSIACHIDYDDEGYILAEAAKIICRDLFNHKQITLYRKLKNRMPTGLCTNIIKIFSVDDTIRTRVKPLK